MMWSIVALLSAILVTLWYLIYQLETVTERLTTTSYLNLEAHKRLLNRIEIMSDDVQHTAFVRDNLTDL